MKFEIIKGDLIAKALAGEFDVIAHGCNCFCTMGAGVAKQIAKTFPAALHADKKTKYGSREKLGTVVLVWAGQDYDFEIANCYTQFHYGKGLQLDYAALSKAMDVLNNLCKGMRIGLPGLIGCGIAGGNPDKVMDILKKELINCNVTICYL